MGHLRRNRSSGHLRHQSADSSHLSTVPSPVTTCPDDACASLPSTYVLTIADLVGNCAGANGSYTLTRPGSSCYWQYVQPGTEGFCDSSTPGSIVQIQLECVPAYPTTPGQWHLTFLLAPGRVVSGTCVTTGQLCSADAEAYSLVSACGSNDPTGDYSLVFANMTCPTDCVDAPFTASIS
jgi:hypothetical protein